mmetsp:Transcript_50503/g.58110  ORF Transcript_50503/g.58110 Transcript_50503/m.58110 type:complete len:522 (+) Transcript_50503:33-1598(+)
MTNDPKEFVRSSSSESSPRHEETEQDASPTTERRDRKKIGPVFAPLKTVDEIHQSAYTTQEAAKEGLGTPQDQIPPVVRSLLELANVMMIGHSSKLRGCPGYQGGLFYGGKPFCIASGYRDSGSPMNMDNKENFIKLKDPLVYGELTIPITATFLCQLHEEGVLDMERPLVEYLPDLGEKFDRLTARSILQCKTTLDDAKILKDCGAAPWKAYLSLNPCESMQTNVYEPINKFFAAGASHAVLNGQQQRSHLVQYLRTAGTSLPKPRSVTNLRSARTISHFSIALLVAAAESQLQGVSFEDSIRKRLFEPCQCHAAGFGAPKVYRDPSDMFYKPSGLSLQHQTFHTPVPQGSLRNCAPPIFNGSLNLYAPVEDMAKLLLLSVDTLRNARDALGPEPITAPHYDMGLWFDPVKCETSLRRNVFRGLDFLPSAAVFQYNAEYDVGVFSVSSCGTRNGRFFSNTFAKVLQHLYVKHIVEKGINPNDSSDDPQAPKSETERKFSKMTKEREYKTVFKSHDAHRRF